MTPTIEKGNLVNFNHQLWRVNSLDKCHNIAYIIDPITDLQDYVPIIRLIKLDAPELLPATKPTIAERRILLTGIITKLYATTSDYKTQETIRRLYNLLTKNRGDADNYWFWNSVTLSVTDPSKIAYAIEPRYIDHEPKRKFCSLSKFLQNTAAKHGFVVEADIIPELAKAFGDLSLKSYAMTVELATGKKIIETYRNGPHSCMIEAEFINWYAENPDKVSILRILHGGKLIGRALVWNTDQGKTVMDRVYPSDNGPATKFAASYAEEQKWLTRRNDDLSELTVTMKRGKRTHFPYLDTFRHTNNDPKTAETIVLNANTGYIHFEDTAGGWCGNIPIMCSCFKCAFEFPRDNAYMITHNSLRQRICGDCFSRLTNSCNYCGTYFLLEDLTMLNNRRCCAECAAERVTTTT